MSLNLSIFLLLAAIGCFALSVYQMLLLFLYVDRHSCFLEFLGGTVCNLSSPGWYEEVNPRLWVPEDLLGLGWFHLEQQVAVGVASARVPPLPSLWASVSSASFPTLVGMAAM